MATAPDPSALHNSIRAVARTVGAPEPTPDHIRELSYHPLVKRFEELLVPPPAERAAGGKDRAAAIQAIKDEGDDLLRSTLVTVVGLIDRAEAADRQQGQRLSRLAADTRESLKRVLKKHAQGQRREVAAMPPDPLESDSEE